MADIEKRLYMIVFPVNALVASQLTPEEFAHHYTTGSAKHFKGKVIFVEIDSKFRNMHFDIDHYLSLTVAHPDGTPKKTKFISSYAVLEHIDLAAMKHLYLVTANGKSLEIKSAPYTAKNEPGMVRIYQEITPLSNLVASTFDQRAFGKYITSGTKSKGAPKVCFTQYEFNVDDFFKKNKAAHIPYSPIPETNVTRLIEYLTEIKTHPDKKTKTINLNSTLTSAPYLLIRHGFWFAAGNELLFYPMPTHDELQKHHYQWLKHAH